MNSASYAGGKWLNKHGPLASIDQKAVLHAYGSHLCPVVIKYI